MQKICLDAGIITLFLTNGKNENIQELKKKIETKQIVLYILKPVLCESFYHICKLLGKDEADKLILSFIHKFSPILVDLDESLILEVGHLKCQNRTKLSYIDCMSIRFAIKEKMFFHTTEKKIKDIPNPILEKLKIVKYVF